MCTKPPRAAKRNAVWTRAQATCLTVSSSEDGFTRARHPVAIALASIRQPYRSLTRPLPTCPCHMRRAIRRHPQERPLAVSAAGEQRCGRRCRIGRRARAAPALRTWATLFNVHTGEAIASSRRRAVVRAHFATPCPIARQQLQKRSIRVARAWIGGAARSGACLELVSGYRSPSSTRCCVEKCTSSRAASTPGGSVDFASSARPPPENEKRDPQGRLGRGHRPVRWSVRPSRLMPTWGPSAKGFEPKP